MTKYSFKKRPGTDAGDPDFVLQHCGQPTRIQIQDPTAWGAAYAVSVDYLDDWAEPHVLWVAQSIASFGEAARVAIGHFEANRLARDIAAAPCAEPGSP